MINNVNLSKISEITKKVKTINENCEIEYRENKMSVKEELNFIRWENVLSIYELLKSKKYACLKYYIILSLYVLIPPRRVLDYSNLYYDNSKPIDLNKIIKIGNPVKKYSNDTDFPDKKNYFVSLNNKGYFIFNDYKTSETYGTQYIELPDELHKILTKYISQSNISQGDSLFGLTQNSFGLKLESIFKSFVNKKIGASGLRHIYIIYEKEQGKLKTINNQLTLALLMGHSVETQQKYWKDVENVNLDCEVDKDGVNKLCNPGK
jgi:hypothetical protein